MSTWSADSPVPVVSAMAVGLAAGAALPAVLARRARTVVEDEERCRIAAVAAGVPMMLCAVPGLLGDFRIAFVEPLQLGGVVFLVVWPLVVGVLSLRRGMARRAPSVEAFATASAMLMLAALGVALNLVAMLAKSWRTSDEHVEVLALVALLLLPLYPLGQGFSRSGWTRWTHLLAGVWLICAAEALFLELASWGPSRSPEIARPVMAFALSTALPGLAWALRPRPGRKSVSRA